MMCSLAIVPTLSADLEASRVALCVCVFVLNSMAHIDMLRRGDRQGARLSWPWSHGREAPPGTFM